MPSASNAPSPLATSQVDDDLFKIIAQPDIMPAEDPAYACEDMNTVGVALDGDAFYFCSGPYGYYNDYLYRVFSDGTGFTLIDSRVGSYVFALDGYAYYSKKDGIYRISHKSCSPEKIKDMTNVIGMNFIDGSMYYLTAYQRKSREGDFAYDLYKADKDGSHAKLVVKRNACLIDRKGGKYYSRQGPYYKQTVFAYDSTASKTMEKIITKIYSQYYEVINDDVYYLTTVQEQEGGGNDTDVPDMVYTESLVRYNCKTHASETLFDGIEKGNVDDLVRYYQYILYTAPVNGGVSIFAYDSRDGKTYNILNTNASEIGFLSTNGRIIMYIDVYVRETETRLERYYTLELKEGRPVLTKVVDL